ncbi:MAG: TIGR02453 family protein, partial [Chloroflexi bacterium]|nr:TIGR02453 family protein [Chloroflexota bacterium]
VREPLLQFITDFGVRLAEISSHYVADARRSGGSLFRINRDIRFSKDKSPYKTAAGVQFRHEAGKDAHAPGFYLHLEPDGVFVGVGLWQPDPPTLSKIRDSIAQYPERWQRASVNEAFQAAFTIGGESLKNPPKGYDPNHPFIEDLKRKDFIASTSFSEAETCAPNFMDRYTELCRRATPYMSFLTMALGLSW